MLFVRACLHFIHGRPVDQQRLHMIDPSTHMIDPLHGRGERRPINSGDSIAYEYVL